MRNIGEKFVKGCLIAVRDCKEMRKIEKGKKTCISNHDAPVSLILG